MAMKKAIVSQTARQEAAGTNINGQPYPLFQSPLAES